MRFFFQFSILYLALNFLLYALVLRNHRHFYQEKTIFLYHAASFAIFFLAGTIFMIFFEHKGWNSWVAAISLHGIYSLSFLELWALSDGGYSLRILDQIDLLGDRADFVFLKALGSSKKKFRLESLKRLGWVAVDPKGWALTARGRAAADFLSFFVAISRQKRKN